MISRYSRFWWTVDRQGFNEICTHRYHTRKANAEATFIKTMSLGMKTLIAMTTTFQIILHISQKPRYGQSP